MGHAVVPLWGTGEQCGHESSNVAFEKEREWLCNNKTNQCCIFFTLYVV